jgi:hypothetical protein
MSIADNVALVRDQIESAARRAGRNPGEIELMAVTKTVPVERVRGAYNAGIRLFGENRVQEFEQKISALRDLSDVRWHMIGHLQTNKATSAAELFNAVESVDSLRVAEKLNTAAAQMEKKLPVLIEINIGHEKAKNGVAADSEELEELLKSAPSLPHLEFGGLMTVPPYSEDPEQSRPFFRKMRGFAGSIQRRGLPGISMNVLSMGMSQDFEIAIEEGATLVRIGTALFGERFNQRGKA